MMWTDETPQETMLNMAMHEIKTLTQTVVELRAERERLRMTLETIAEHGPAMTWHALAGICACALALAAEELSTKGSYGAECNRASCHNVPATWKHRDIPRHYCPPCGMWINENNSDCDPPLCGPVSGDAT